MSKVELLKISDLRIPETEVPSLFDDHLEVVEDGLRHVRSQVRIGVGVIDTIAIDDNNIPVIIEYKSKWGYVHVYSEEQIDDELLTWIKRAYERVES